MFLLGFNQSFAPPLSGAVRASTGSWNWFRAEQINACKYVRYGRVSDQGAAPSRMCHAYLLWRRCARVAHDNYLRSTTNVLHGPFCRSTVLNISQVLPQCFSQNYFLSEDPFRPSKSRQLLVATMTLSALNDSVDPS
jgi:hypothetical protein